MTEFDVLQIYGAICDFRKPSRTFSHLTHARSCEGASGTSVLKMKPRQKVKPKRGKARIQTSIFCLPGLNTSQHIQILKNIVIGSSSVQCTHETHQEEEEGAKTEEVGEEGF